MKTRAKTILFHLILMSGLLLSFSGFSKIKTNAVNLKLGKIDTIVVPPRFAGTNKLYTHSQLWIHVYGSGKCNVLNVNWGDGTPAQKIQHTPLPRYRITHTYKQAGIKNIKVSGVGCRGKSAVTLHVVAKDNVLSRAKCKKPKISRLKLSNGATTKKLKPGDLVFIEGCGFGDKKGRLNIKAKGYLKPINATILKWANKGISIKLPYLSLNKDYSITIQAQHKPIGLGYLSNQYQALLEYKRTTRKLRYGEMEFVCGKKASGRCPLSHTAVMSAHWDMPKNYPKKTYDFVVDQDIAKIRLINGWKIKKIHFNPITKAGSVASIPGGFYKGSKHSDIKVQYQISRTGSVNYYLQIDIEGPGGLPATKAERMKFHLKKSTHPTKIKVK